MNKQTEALKMAIEAMENSIVYCEDLHHAKKDQHKYTEPCPVEQRWNATIQACKEALEQPAPEYVYVNPVTKDMYYLTKSLEQPAQEPVAYEPTSQEQSVMHQAMIRSSKVIHKAHPAPSWQGLSEHEINNIGVDCQENDGVDLWKFARAIEQALKEKNG